MNFTETPLAGSYIITPEPIGDSRGWFARTYCKNEFRKIGHSDEWVQMNHSYTAKKGSIRGMHFQEHPHGEIKLIRCIAGAVFDVIIDLRKDSKTYLNWYGTELSAANKLMIYIPKGFAHGFQAMENDTELLYNHSAYYNPVAERGVRFDDPLINIKWPLEITEVSERDRQHIFLNSND